MSVVTMKQLLEAGVHFGHQTRRWDPKMAPYIFTQRNGIYIIDLQKTIKMLDDAYNYTKAVAADGAAGDDDGLQIEAAQEPGVLPGVFENGIPAAVAVGDTGCVAEVYNVFRGHDPAQLPHCGQAAEAGVEYPDGPCVHGPTSLHRLETLILYAIPLIKTRADFAGPFLGTCC